MQVWPQVTEEEFQIHLALLKAEPNKRGEKKRISHAISGSPSRAAAAGLLHTMHSYSGRISQGLLFRGWKLDEVRGEAIMVMFLPLPKAKGQENT